MNKGIRHTMSVATIQYQKKTCARRQEKEAPDRARWGGGGRGEVFSVSGGEPCGCADRVHLLTVGIRQIPKNKKSLVLSAKIWLEPGSSVEIGDMASPHWRRGGEVTGYNTYPLCTWVGQMGAEGVASRVKTAFIQTLT